MTIIVGLVGTDGLVIASDSQATSWRGVDVKRLDYTKIENFTAGELHVVVTGAGRGGFITNATERFKHRCSEERPISTDKLRDIAEDTYTELLKRYVVDRMEKLGMARLGAARQSARAKWQDEMALPFHMMVAAWPRKKDAGPGAIYTVTHEGVAEKAHNFDSLGSGSAYAEYLLSKMYRENLPVEGLLLLAVYVVEQVKQIDPSCGGRTQAVTITKDGARRPPPEEIEELARRIEFADISSVGVWWLVAVGAKTKEEVRDFLVAQEGQG